MVYRVYISREDEEQFEHPLPQTFSQFDDACQVATKYYNKGYDLVTVEDGCVPSTNIAFEITCQPRPVVYTTEFNLHTNRHDSRPHVYYLSEDYSCNQDGRPWIDIWTFAKVVKQEFGDFTEEALWYNPDIEGPIDVKETCVNVYNGDRLTIYYSRVGANRPTSGIDRMEMDDVAFILEWE